MASNHTRNSGTPLGVADFFSAAKFSRGLVWVVEVAGLINTGDTFIVKPYQPAPWLNLEGSGKTAGHN